EAQQVADPDDAAFNAFQVADQQIAQEARRKILSEGLHLRGHHPRQASRNTVEFRSNLFECAYHCGDFLDKLQAILQNSRFIVGGNVGDKLSDGVGKLACCGCSRIERVNEAWLEKLRRKLQPEFCEKLKNVV